MKQEVLHCSPGFCALSIHGLLRMYCKNLSLLSELTLKNDFSKMHRVLQGDVGFDTLSHY